MFSLFSSFASVECVFIDSSLLRREIKTFFTEGNEGNKEGTMKHGLFVPFVLFC